MKWDSPQPEQVFHGGRCIGVLMPKAKPEHLGLGIQPWSIPQPKNPKRVPMKAHLVLNKTWRGSCPNCGADLSYPDGASRNATCDNCDQHLTLEN